MEAPSYELNRDLHSYLDMVKLQLKVNIQVRATRTKGKFTLPPKHWKTVKSFWITKDQCKIKSSDNKKVFKT